ncbi:MAG: NHL repeat-containing protein [Pirellulales bacterium]
MLPNAHPGAVPLAKAICLAAAVALLAGCDEPSDAGRVKLVWGQQGISDGRLQKPRAMAIDGQDHLYIVDMTAHIQVFDTEGHFIRGWYTPTHDNGRPTGISIGRDGRVLVPDTHYFRVLIYSPAGDLLQTVGGTNGTGPGTFGFVTDVAEDNDGNYYIAEYGEHDRIQKFSHDGNFIKQWGGHGVEPGEFIRPQSIIFDEQQRLWVADSCNHRIQVFNTDGELLFLWGEEGPLPGQLQYPYSLIFDPEGNLYICEYGNHRLQKFTREGKPLGCWGTHGRGPGQMHNPWAVVQDSGGNLHILDSSNHRVQQIPAF